MDIESTLATKSDIEKLDDMNDMISEYDDMLDDVLEGEPLIDKRIFDQYVLKIKVSVNNTTYYIFYCDREPDAGIHGFITNSNYHILTDTYYYEFWENSEWNEDAGWWIGTHLKDADKANIKEIHKWFHTHYGEEDMCHTDEYWKIFTLMKEEEDNWYKFNENDDRFKELMATLIFDQ